MTNLMRRNNQADNFYDMVDAFFNGMPRSDEFTNSFKIDIAEDDEKFLVEAELPGFAKEDIDIDLDKGKLTLSVKKESSEDKSDEKRNYIHKERRYQSMRRTMNFTNIDEENVSAKLANGILEISLPKSKKDLKKKIQID
ncbi:MAG: Hsp20/alpha crystallin family protein [Anaerococcus sp.]|nr:Hsp20/alpha crystallin family protein [Anaerococcus sp.]